MNDRLRILIDDLAASSNYDCCDGLYGLHAPWCERLQPVEDNRG